MQVEMCTSIVRYMLQQGYGPDQITVLTPYLGQLLELQKALSAEFQVGHVVMDIPSAGGRSAGDYQPALSAAVRFQKGNHHYFRFDSAAALTATDDRLQSTLR
jgi:hypothetical protein